MAWISVHEDVDATKLRRLYQAIGCSKFEALGILNFLWFWGLKNADETGLAQNADLDVLNRYLYGCGEGSDLDMRKVVQALVDVGFIDLAPGGFILHDWDTWQSQWYKYQRTKEYNAERMRRTRNAEKERRNQETPPEAHEDPEPPKGGELVEQKPEEPERPKEPEKPKKAPKEKTPKVKYAELVHMTEGEYKKLVEKYGVRFTKACISKLDNYKGSKGKSYKDDYRTILNWVVSSVNEDNPGLLNASRSDSSVQNERDPFREWGENNG